MATVMKLVNYLKASSALQHRLLLSFLTEVNAAFDDLLRWLSKGKVLENIWALLKELEMFRLDQKIPKTKLFANFMKHEKRMETFLADITFLPNDLDLKLEGKNNTLCDLMSAVCSFQWTLEIFKCDIQEGFLCFPKLMECTAGKHHLVIHAESLDKLIENFQTLFGDFCYEVLPCIEIHFLDRNVTELGP